MNTAETEARLDASRAFDELKRALRTLRPYVNPTAQRTIDAIVASELFDEV